MGETKVQVRVSGEKGSKVIEAIVDTGATNTVVEQSLARELGIGPIRVDQVVLADGTTDTVGVGSAEVEIHGVRTVVPVYIYTENLVGLTTLEAAGFRVNPVTGELEKVPGRLLFIRPK